jgi:hypothetical protein
MQIDYGVHHQTFGFKTGFKTTDFGAFLCGVQTRGAPMLPMIANSWIWLRLAGATQSESRRQGGLRVLAYPDSATMICVFGGCQAVRRQDVPTKRIDGKSAHSIFRGPQAFHGYQDLTGNSAVGRVLPRAGASSGTGERTILYTPRSHAHVTRVTSASALQVTKLRGTALRMSLSLRSDERMMGNGSGSGKTCVVDL